MAGDSSSPGRRKFRKTIYLMIQISAGVKCVMYMTKILPMFCFLVAMSKRGGGCGASQYSGPPTSKSEDVRPGHTATEKREPRNEKTVVQSKISSSTILFLGTRKLDDFQDRQPTDFLPPRKILTNQREVQ